MQRPNAGPLSMHVGAARATVVRPPSELQALVVLTFHPRQFASNSFVTHWPLLLAPAHSTLRAISTSTAHAKRRHQKLIGTKLHQQKGALYFLRTAHCCGGLMYRRKKDCVNKATDPRNIASVSFPLKYRYSSHRNIAHRVNSWLIQDSCVAV